MPKKQTTVWAILIVVIAWVILLSLIWLIVLSFSPSEDAYGTNAKSPISNVYTIQNNSNSNLCNIKGNISFSTGEKVYHLPGQKYYNSTEINTNAGEKYFCTEQEALLAGWRKSKY